MNRLFITFLFVAATIVASAQNFSGVATYQSSTKLDIKIDSSKIPPEALVAMRNMMRQQMQKEFQLIFNKSTSTFDEVEALEQGNAMFGNMMMMMTGNGGGQVYRNASNQQLLEQKEFFGKFFLVEDTTKNIQWKLGKESKQVGSYTCYRATTVREFYVRKVNDEDMNDSILDKDPEMEVDSVTITAWYTPQIPVNHGPDLYYGLPGLIMEVTNGTTRFLCTKIELNMKESVEIEAPKKGDRVSREEYNTIVMDKMKEMAKMQQGRGGPRGRGSMQIKIAK